MNGLSQKTGQALALCPAPCRIREFYLVRRSARIDTAAAPNLLGYVSRAHRSADSSGRTSSLGCRSSGHSTRQLKLDHIVEGLPLTHEVRFPTRKNPTLRRGICLTSE